MVRLLSCALLLLATLAPLAAPARAEPSDEARILFQAGVAATSAQRWSEARDYFRRSAALVEKPATLFNLAIVEIKLGLGVEALTTLSAFDRIATPEHASMLEGVPRLRAQAEQLAARQRSGDGTLGEVQDVAGLDGEARALFEAGQSAYWAGRYPQALEYFERAHALSNRPELLYDIGAAADRLRDDARALTALRAYLAADPGTPRAEAVRARIAVLEQLPQPARTALPAPSVRVDPPRTPARAERGVGPGLWKLSAGVLALGGSVGTFLWWRERIDARDDCAAAGERCSNLAQLDRHRRTLLATSVLLDVGGVVLLTAGALDLATRRPLFVRASAAPGAFQVSAAAQF